jgi:hypothetical protein
VYTPPPNRCWLFRMVMGVGKCFDDHNLSQVVKENIVATIHDYKQFGR